jgi:hypothetical protein
LLLSPSFGRLWRLCINLFPSRSPQSRCDARKGKVSSRKRELIINVTVNSITTTKLGRKYGKSSQNLDLENDDE